MSPATLASMSRRAAERLRVAAGHMEELAARKARVKHPDETGLRPGGRTRRLHAMRAPLLAAYRVSERRGAAPEGVSGIAARDHWQCCWPMAGVEHALCNAHRLRELQALVEFVRRGGPGAASGACGAGAGHCRSGRLPARIVRGYDRLLVEAMKVHEDRTPLSSPGRCGTPGRRKGRNLALRLHARRDETLRFRTDAPAPFTNNEAGRDLRMMKRRRKISGGFRSRRDADDFALLRSVIATARKQRRDVLNTLTGPPESFIKDIRYA